METQAQQLDTKIELINESADPIAPRDAREDSLFEVWRKVLGRDDLGVEDNFFERGGDSSAALREALSAELPAYMAPSVFQVVDSLPLTPNGKINWNRLP